MNVLVDDSGRAVVADFGLVDIADPAGKGIVDETAQSGTKQYMAPELHKPDAFGCKDFQRTRESDVYSYGSLCLEVNDTPLIINS